jgi:hypothetical protein
VPSSARASGPEQSEISARELIDALALHLEGDALAGVQYPQTVAKEPDPSSRLSTVAIDCANKSSPSADRMGAGAGLSNGVDEQNFTETLVGWERFAPNVVPWRGPGNHMTVLKMPHVIDLVEWLNIVGKSA